MTVFLSRYLQKLPKKTRAIVLTCLYGIVAGVAAVLFHKTIQWLFNGTIAYFATLSAKGFLIGSLLTMTTTSLAVGWLLNQLSREASGSGIPQLKIAFWKDFGQIPWRVTWVKFVAGVLSIGGGASMGREGPSVQLASGVASNLAGLLPIQWRHLYRTLCHER
ncbi:MAG: hypothetical protein EBU26_11605 [Verrucomicrobia bacterium]|nr:hypothetical protein [Verrucomicrobiota bacterium]